MNKRITAATLALTAALAAAACGGGDNHNGTHNGNAAGNTARPANANTAAAANTNRGIDWKVGISEEDLKKRTAEYRGEATRLKDSVADNTCDLYIWTKVRAELARIDGLSDSVIIVDVNDGVVTLKRNVTGDQKTKAAAAVVKMKQSKDIKDFKNELKAS